MFGWGLYRDTQPRTQPCGARNCKCCKMLSDKDSCTIDDTTVKFVGGTCSSYNVIYIYLPVKFVVNVMLVGQPAHLRPGLESIGGRFINYVTRKKLT